MKENFSDRQIQSPMGIAYFDCLVIFAARQNLPLKEAVYYDGFSKTAAKDLVEMNV